MVRAVRKTSKQIVWYHSDKYEILNLVQNHDLENSVVIIGIIYNLKLLHTCRTSEKLTRALQLLRSDGLSLDDSVLFQQVNLKARANARVIVEPNILEIVVC